MGRSLATWTPLSWKGGVPPFSCLWRKQDQLLVTATQKSSTPFSRAHNVKSDFIHRGFFVLHTKQHRLSHERLINMSHDMSLFFLSTLSDIKLSVYISRHLPVSIKIFQTQTCYGRTKHTSLTLANCIPGMLKLLSTCPFNVPCPDLHTSE